MKPLYPSLQSNPFDGGIIEKGWRFLKLPSQTAMVASSAKLPVAVRCTKVCFADKARFRGIRNKAARCDLCDTCLMTQF
jgi:hypothetical protein